MIVTIADCATPGSGVLVAENLALLRARARRKLLLDASTGQNCDRWCIERLHARLRSMLTVRPLRGLGCSSELERLRAGFDDMVILIEGFGSNECRWALIAAQVEGKSNLTDQAVCAGLPSGSGANRGRGTRLLGSPLCRSGSQDNRVVASGANSCIRSMAKKPRMD